MPPRRGKKRVFRNVLSLQMPITVLDNTIIVKIDDT
jgi:hypothetical protein